MTSYDSQQETQAHPQRDSTHRMATAQGLDVQKGKDLVALKELERRDLSWPASVDGRCLGPGYTPLMILQKMHAADMFFLCVCVCVKTRPRETAR